MFEKTRQEIVKEPLRNFQQQNRILNVYLIHHNTIWIIEIMTSTADYGWKSGYWNIMSFNTLNNTTIQSTPIFETWKICCSFNILYWRD